MIRLHRMFKTLGLLQTLPCPEATSCSRTRCLFSHTMAAPQSAATTRQDGPSAAKRPRMDLEVPRTVVRLPVQGAPPSYVPKSSRDPQNPAVTVTTTVRRAASPTKAQISPQSIVSTASTGQPTISLANPKESHT